MKEGFYSINYTGTTGSGFGLITMDTGVIVGVDITGIEYDGTYEYDEGSKMIEAKIAAKVPIGVNLVTGVLPDRNFDFKISFPRQTTNTSLTIKIPGGTVDAIIKFLRHFPN